MADLKKDYFLLCKKENLARTHSSTKNSKTAITLQPTSCSSASHVESPTSPCQWNVGFRRLQQLDSVFDGDVKSATDATSPEDNDTKEVSKDNKSLMVVA